MEIAITFSDKLRMKIASLISLMIRRILLVSHASDVGDLFVSSTMFLQRPEIFAMKV